jgi:hypothetical protein
LIISTLLLVSHPSIITYEEKSSDYNRATFIGSMRALAEAGPRHLNGYR